MLPEADRPTVPEHPLPADAGWGRFVYLAGQTSADGKEATTQAGAVFATIDTLLRKAGTDRSHLVQVTIWLADIGDFGAVIRIWRAWNDGASAPLLAIGKAPLPAPENKIEIVATAILPVHPGRPTTNGFAPARPQEKQHERLDIVAPHWGHAIRSISMTTPRLAAPPSAS